MGDAIRELPETAVCGHSAQVDPGLGHRIFQETLSDLRQAMNQHSPEVVVQSTGKSAYLFILRHMEYANFNFSRQNPEVLYAGAIAPCFQGNVQIEFDGRGNVTGLKHLNK